MLIEFEVGNFLSFNKPVRLSMVATNTDKELLETNTFEAERCRLLRSTAIYGANASGKSNLISAMAFMQWFVANSSRETQAQDKILAIPFKLDYATESAPSRFETSFLLAGKLYRYGFEATPDRVTAEWLFRAEKVKEEALFLRDNDGIDVRDDFSEGLGLESKTRDNALFLSVVAQFNGQLSQAITNWFGRFKTLYGLYDSRYEDFSALMMLDKQARLSLLKLIQEADLGIEGIDVVETSEDGGNSTLAAVAGRVFRGKRFLISSQHRKYRDGQQADLVPMDFLTEESEGTKKFFRIAGPLLDCIQNGYTVCIDELDAKLHPLLTRAVVRLFNSPANKNNAQLIFTTHDTNLLQYGGLRRDQIWFTEKNQQSATDLYSLAEFKTPVGVKVRNDAAYEKNYIQGKYGAIPFLGDFGSFLKGTGNE